MVNTQYLVEKIRSSGKKKGYLAEKCGLTRQGLANKLNNKSSFTVDEVTALCKELGVTTLTEKERIFFGPELKEQ